MPEGLLATASSSVRSRGILGSRYLRSVKSFLGLLSLRVRAQIPRKVRRLKRFRSAVRNYTPRPIFRKASWRRLAYRFRRLRRKQKNHILETRVPNIYSGPLGFSKVAYPEDYSDPHDELRYLIDPEDSESESESELPLT